MEDNKTTQEIANQIKDKLDQTIAEMAIKDNKIEFEYKENKYRVRKATVKEKQEIFIKKNQKFIDLLQQKDSNGNFVNKTEEDLKKIYKDRGIDIDEMMNKFNNLENQKKDFQYKLGEALAKNKADNELNIFKDEIEKIEAEERLISVKKSNLLEFSVESQLVVYSYMYYAYLVTDKFVDNNWVRLWETYETLENTEENLLERVLFHIPIVAYNDIQ